MWANAMRLMPSWMTHEGSTTVIQTHCFHWLFFCCFFSGSTFFDIDDGRSGDIHSPPTQHFTIIFNTFVMMTLCNEVNARKIHGQRNILEGLRRNPVFIGIWIGTFVAQVRTLFSFVYGMVVQSMSVWSWLVGRLDVTIWK